MALFKCKMCGGTLEIAEGTTVCECEYCGTKQTLPKLDNDRKENLYDRANHFRRNNDFDKAMGIYEQILNEDSSDAEAYWSLVLCRYGIEYVEDPDTHKRVPTVNRVQFTPVLADENYKAAIQHADTSQKAVYEAEAKSIDDIQKGILEISKKEKPFDVFICYKESDDQGRRTQDSVLANDLYHQLKQEGFNVFFSRITLEDKLGTAYEPYIFAALNSAKVMIVLGTKPEFFTAVWVRNEWSRFLTLIKKGENKVLIPAYRDMDPYDLPEEFSHLQAQDMSKLGFMQDLIRGIKKIVKDSRETYEDKKEEVKQQNSIGNTAALLKRGYMALEDGEWRSADEFFEEVLNQDAENSSAYMGKLMAKKECSDLQQLESYYIRNFDNPNKQVLVACEEDHDHITEMADNYALPGYLERDEIIENYYADRDYQSSLNIKKECEKNVLNELENEKLYIRARKYAKDSEKDEVEKLFDDIKKEFDDKIKQAEVEDEASIKRRTENYNRHIKETDEKIVELSQKAKDKKQKYYESLIEAYENASSLADYDRVTEKFQAMGGYSDSEEYIEKCKEKRNAIEKEDLEKEENEKRKRKKIAIAIAGFLVACVIYLVIVNIVIPPINYDKARSLEKSKKYEKALEYYKKAGDYKDSKKKLEKMYYIKATGLYNEKKYEKALKYYKKSGSKYRETLIENYIKKGIMCNEATYRLANVYIKDGDVSSAKAEYLKISDYKDSIKKYLMLATKKIGDEVYYGSYKGKKCTWRVWDIETDEIILLSTQLSDNGVDGWCKTKTGDWENSNIRKWLNKEFLNKIFSKKEQLYMEEMPYRNGDKVSLLKFGNGYSDEYIEDEGAPDYGREEDFLKYYRRSDLCDEDERDYYDEYDIDYELDENHFLKHMWQADDMYGSEEKYVIPVIGVKRISK